MRRAAILTRVREAIEATAKRCDNLVVIAHSQGAAIAHTVLDKAAPANLDTLITYGSGLDKLTRIERRGGTEKGSVGQRIAFSAACLLVLVLVSATVHIEGSNAFRIVGACTLFSVSLAELATIIVAWRHEALDVLGGRSSAIQAITISLTTLFLGGYILAEPWIEAALRVTLLTLGMTFVLMQLWDQGMRMALPGMASFDDFVGKQSTSCRGFKWYDIYATHDPVPNGKMQFHEPSGSIQVVNRRSTFSDHTSYWRNGDEFVTHVMKILSDHWPVADSLVLGDFDRLDEIKRKRSLRVRWLQVTRYLVAALTILLMIGITKLNALLGVTVGNQEGLIGRTTAEAWAIVLEFPVASPLIFSAACGFLVYFLLYGVWSVWDGLAIRST
jgi:hypothetical protein